jgi:hypothetical protein
MELKQGEIKKILVFRSAPMERVRQVLKVLKNKFPSAFIDVLAQSQVMDELREDFNVEKVIEYPGERMSPSQAGKKLIKRLQGGKYDLIVIPYNIGGEFSYFPVKRLAREIKPRYVLGISIEGKASLINAASNWIFKPKNSIDELVVLPVKLGYKGRIGMIDIGIELIGILLFFPLLLLTILSVVFAFCLRDKMLEDFTLN